MDISDILADATSHIPYRSQEESDHIALTRAWVNERNAPEILPWPTDLIDRVMSRLRSQIEKVEDSFSDTDPASNFKSIIVQTELERFKYLVRVFIRTRVAKVYRLLGLTALVLICVKIDAHALYYLSSPEQTVRLSPSELSYARSHQALMSNHYHSSFLSQFPASLQKLDDTAGGISMVEQPDFDKTVIVRVLRSSNEEVSVEGTDIEFSLEQGSIMVVRWSAIKEVIERGDAELI